jgi:hypothetical protein
MSPIHQPTYHCHCHINQLVTVTVTSTYDPLSTCLSTIIQPVTVTIIDIPSSTNYTKTIIHSHGYQNHHQTMYINQKPIPYHVHQTMYHIMHNHVSTMYQPVPYHVHQPCTIPCINHVPNQVHQPCTISRTS